MNPSDERKIEEWGRRLADTVSIEVVLDGDAQNGRSTPGKMIAGFCERLNQLAPEVTVNQKEGTEPGIRIAPNIVYQAVPENQEMDIFLDALDGTLKPAGGVIEPPDMDRLSRLASSVRLDVYISSHCPFCPHVVTALLLTAQASERVNVKVVDGTLFPEKAQSLDIKAVPTVILDNGFRWTGQVDMNEIMAVAVSGADADFGAETLKSIVEAGNAETVAKMMLDKGEIYSAYIDLLTDEKWSVRLGAMVVFEYIAESDDAMAGQVVEALWERFDRVDNSVKGDILHLYGESGRPDARKKVETVLAGDYAEEVKESAREALE
ncbi:MAG: thioredoxin family protein [Thermodesulfobacteriota bacterium]|nr:thioredoxin family protein [Thermodesulfobacteriota bacterium]